MKKVGIGNAEGWHCESNPDGSKTCRRFEADGENKSATGTEITISTNPNQFI